MKIIRLILLSLSILLYSCKTNDDCCTPNPQESKQLIIKFKFDPTQKRLNNLGELALIPAGNAAQSPNFARMSANYIEFAPSANTLLGEGEIIFEGSETTIGGEKAIDFKNAKFAGNKEVFLSIPLNQLTPGTYNWVRISLAYQEGDIDVRSATGMDFTGTLASFVGYNTYIESLNFNGSTSDPLEINENKLQGFWAFDVLGTTTQGQAPEGATTVPNPIFNSSPIPQGSCVVTGQFENEFTITGEENEDITITLSFSVNNSFEWTEVNVDGKYEPSAGEQVVDMGLRGLIPYISN